MVGLLDFANVAAAVTQDPGGGSQFNWLTAIFVPLIAASIPASIGVLISRSDRQDARLAARQAQESNEEIERLRLLERRVSERKAQAYSDYLPEFAKLLSGKTADKSKTELAKQTDTLLRASNKFWHESLVYSSDDVQRAFARAMQSAFHNAPAVITMRLFGDLVIAMRMDMWADASELTSMDVWAPKINDMFTHEWVPGLNMHEVSKMPFSALCKKAEWSRPWAGTPLDHREAEEDRLTRA